MTKAEQYRSALEKIATAKAEAKELAKDAFAEMTAALFGGYPLLESFSWKQYTPYFNDGDPCTFSARVEDQECIAINGEDGYEISEDCDYKEVNGKWERRGFDESELHPLYKAQKAACELLCQVSHEQLEEMFGDHAKITVHRNGTVEVEECSHD